MPEEKEVEATQGTDKVQVCAKKENYVKSRTAQGKPSLNCGDAVASAFSGLSISQKYALTSKLLDVDRKELEEKYGHLNIGMQGMSLANRVRGALNKDAKLEKPTGLLEQMDKIVAPIQKEAKAIAEKEAKAKADAKVKADLKKKAQAKADADAKKKADTKAA